MVHVLQVELLVAEAGDVELRRLLTDRLLQLVIRLARQVARFDGRLELQDLREVVVSLILPKAHGTGIEADQEGADGICRGSRHASDTNEVVVEQLRVNDVNAISVYLSMLIVDDVRVELLVSGLLGRLVSRGQVVEAVALAHVVDAAVGCLYAARLRRQLHTDNEQGTVVRAHQDVGIVG